jgi:hypothetical protein
MTKIKICKICGTKIITKQVYDGTLEGKRRLITVSDEGVIFNECNWFCNKCWDKIIIEVKKNGRL